MFLVFCAISKCTFKICLGIYDVINNLGSLVARFLFLPIEDAGALFFTRTLERGRSCSELKWVCQPI